MNLKIFAALTFWILLFAVSCNRDEISFNAPSQQLRFSKDTVFCDTVYNQVRSETYAVKVYNDEDQDIMIPKISLASGSSSLYRINVDGKAGTEFNNVPLRKKDSLYIFVEIAPVASAPEAIAEDQVVFQSPAGNQHVTLFSVVQDAEFFIQNDSNPNILNEDTNWTNEKAKIIFGDLTVAEGKQLSIQPGTKVYFFKNSGLKISKNASLNVNGVLGSEVLFRGDRNDPRYDTIPKNWNGISLDEGSNLNMNYAKLQGGDIGLDLYQSNANISNTIFHTFQNYGIRSVASTLTAENLVMNHCGEANLGIFKGGSVQLTHCTLANYWEMNSSLPGLSLFATNSWTNSSGQEENGALQLNVYNSVLYGRADNAVFFKPVSGQNFSYLFSHSALKYAEGAGYNFEGNPAVVTCLKNQDPKFLNTYASKMNLRVAEDSPVKGKGIYLNAVSRDITGVIRNNPPTMGAYE